MGRHLAALFNNIIHPKNDVLQFIQFLDLGHYKKKSTAVDKLLIHSLHTWAVLLLLLEDKTLRMELLCQKKRIFFNLNSYCQTAFQKNCHYSHCYCQCTGATVSLVPEQRRKLSLFWMGEKRLCLTSILWCNWCSVSLFFLFFPFCPLIADHAVFSWSGPLPPLASGSSLFVSRLTSGTQGILHYPPRL